VRDAKAVRWTHSCIGANNVTIVMPCTAIAGTSKYQNGRAPQTSSAVAAMQAPCAPNCNAPRKSERSEIPLQFGTLEKRAAGRHRFVRWVDRHRMRRRVGHAVFVSSIVASTFA
jgi:hypothetical protein